MNRRDQSANAASPSRLEESVDEIQLSNWMRKSLEGDSESYRLLLEKVKDLMTPFIAHSISKFGLAASGGQEDVLQEILLAIHHKRKTFDPKQFFLPWMYAIARYKTIDYLRKNKASFRSVSIEDSFEEFEISQSPEMDSGMDIESLCEKLPQKQRELLLLVKVDGLSIAEAATKTGFSVSDVKVTIHRALKELKKQVQEVDHENG